MTHWTAGDFDYDSHGDGYSNVRRPDPRIAAQVARALGDARTVLNVGAGAGSYEPTDRYVAAVEPSATMRAQRSPRLAPGIDAVAESLPFDDGAFDASMAMLTVHHWPDIEAGLRELQRVTRGPVVILTFDDLALERFWLNDYAPELIAVERRRFPPIDLICDALEGTCTVEVVTIPLDCTDGFGDAFYGRPEQFLDPAVRNSQSGWGFVDADAETRTVDRLRVDLDSGEWDRRYGHLRTPTLADTPRRGPARRSGPDPLPAPPGDRTSLQPASYLMDAPPRPTSPIGPVPQHFESALATRLIGGRAFGASTTRPTSPEPSFGSIARALAEGSDL